MDLHTLPDYWSWFAYRYLKSQLSAFVTPGYDSYDGVILGKILIRLCANKGFG